MRHPESGFRPTNEPNKETKKRPSMIEILSAAIIASISIATVRDVLQSLSHDEKTATVTTEEPLPKADPRPKTRATNRESFASDTTRRENPENVTERLLEDIGSTVKEIIPKILPPEKHETVESYTRDGDLCTNVTVMLLGTAPESPEDLYRYSGYVHDSEYSYDFGLRWSGEDGLQITHLVIRDYEEEMSEKGAVWAEDLQKFDEETIEDIQPEIKNRLLKSVGEATHEWQELIANDEYHSEYNPEDPIDRAGM